MLPRWSMIRSAELSAGTYWRDQRETGYAVSNLVRQAARLAFPFYRPSQWRANASRLSWLFRTYRVSLVLVQKRAA
jgi:hypothetical protein